MLQGRICFDVRLGESSVDGGTDKWMVVQVHEASRGAAAVELLRGRLKHKDDTQAGLEHHFEPHFTCIERLTTKST